MPEKVFYREARLEAKADETGVMRLSFASELPVLRKDSKGEYYEVLSHAPGDANLGFMNRAGMVLQDHDEKMEIGDVVKDSAKVEKDKKTRADIKIFDGTWLNRAKTVPNEIPVSVGYNRLSIVSRKTDADGIQTRCYSWRPYEISLLTKEPADDTVGLNRMKKRRCAECEGHGRCRCRAKDEDEADEDCEHCDGKGKCSDCGGDGYFESARSKPVDFEKLTEAEKTILRNKFMAEKNETVIVEADVRKDERSKASKETSDQFKSRAKEIAAVTDGHVAKHGNREVKDGDKTVILRDKISTIANEALQTDITVEAFKVRCLELISTAEPEQVHVRDIVPGEEMAQFSMIRAIQGAAKERIGGREGRPTVKTLEGDIIKTYEDKLRQADGGVGFAPQGFIIPPDAQFGSHLMSRAEMRSAYRRDVNRYGRDMQATLFGAGGAVVPTFWQLPVIELLKNKIVLARLGTRVVSGLTGNVIFPRLEAPTTAYSASEIQALTASQLTLGQLQATPHRVGVTVPYSKQLVFQSAPDIESLIREDMMEQLGLKWDYLGLNGQGANDEPLGIMNTPGIGTVTFGATPTYIKMVAFETAIRSQNVMDRLAYISTSLTKGSLKTVAEALTGATTIGGSANALWKSVGQDGEEDGRVNGWPAIDSQQVPNNAVLCGGFNQFMHCLWSGLDIVVDYYTKAVNAEIAVTMNTWGDYVARHAQAFCVSTDAGNQ